MTSNKRILYLDLLRIFATFGVIILHVASTQWYKLPVASTDWKIVNLFHSTMSWAVPIFVMISGYFFLKNNKIGEKGSCNVEYSILFRKNIFRILCALFFWGSFYGLFSLTSKVYKSQITDLLNIKAADLFFIFRSIISHSSAVSYHLWFLYMIIGLYLITPFIRIFIKNARRDYIKYFLYLFFLLGTCIPFFNYLFYYIPYFDNFQIYIRIPELSGYTGYYIAGYYLATYELSKPKKILIALFSLISLVLTVLLTVYISTKNDKPLSDFFKYILSNTMLIAIAIFLAFKQYLSKIKISANAEKLIFVISKYTFGIYLVQVFVIQILEKFHINILFTNFFVSIPIISIFVFAISLSITYMIDKIPILRKYII